MRGIRTAGVGLTVALSASTGLGQTPPAAAAARIVGVQAVGADGGAARGQAADPGRGYPLGMPAPMPSSPVAQQPPGSSPLGPPKPLPSPNVTEQRGTPGAPAAPAATMGQPLPYGQPVPYGPPMAGGPPCPVPGSVVAGQPVAGPGGGYGVPTVLPPDALFPSAVPVAPAVTGPLAGGALGTLAGPQRLQLRTDFLLWFVKSSNIPPLVTASSVPYNGIIGTGDTRTLYGGENVGQTLHTGWNFGGTYWLGDRQTWGLDGNIFFLNRSGDQFAASTDQYPLLARPFNNLNQGIPFSEVIGATGLANGGVIVTNESQMWGADVSLRRHLLCAPCARLDGFAGFRYLNLNESLAIDEYFARTPGSPLDVGVPTASSGYVTDRVRTVNNFYGGMVGLAGEVRRGRWFAEGRTSIAMGTVFQSAQLDGAQVITNTDGSRSVTQGGLLTAPGANIGTFTKHRFGVLPEVGVKFGYHVTPNLRVAVGYNLLYLNSVLRPGDQLDTGLDVTRINNFPLPGNVAPLGTVRPAPTLRATDVFAQGVTFSVQWTW